MPRLERLDEAYDVVVAGGGAAGLMAAVEAAETGADVLLVERQPELGGTTAMAVGTISASGTELQRAAGISDDVEAHYRDYLEFIPPDRRPTDYDLELTRLLVERAPDALARLMELGVRFAGPQPEPPHTVYRMHNVVPDAGAYIDALERAAGERGATVITSTAVDRLELDGSGAVEGLTLRDVRNGAAYRTKVRGGVVLATGYFSANGELSRAHGRPDDHDTVEPLYEAASGDGITLATAVGAVTAGMWAGSAPHFRTVNRPYVHPGHELFEAGAVLVNRDGRRFADELHGPETATSRQPGGVAFVVFDSRLAGRMAVAADDSGRSRDGWYRKGKMFLSTFPAIGYAYVKDYHELTDYFFEAWSPSRLAAQIQVPAGDLDETLRRLNDAATGRGADPFGRDPVGLGVSEPPLYAVGPIKAVLGSSGGLSVDRDMHVLDGSGRPIPCLYAAGMNGSANTLIAGHGHALAWAFSTGRIAGANAAKGR